MVVNCHKLAESWLAGIDSERVTTTYTPELDNQRFSALVVPNGGFGPPGRYTINRRNSLMITSGFAW